MTSDTSANTIRPARLLACVPLSYRADAVPDGTTRATTASTTNLSDLKTSDLTRTVSPEWSRSKAT
jgi:hypothetical protein